MQNWWNKVFGCICLKRVNKTHVFPTAGAILSLDLKSCASFPRAASLVEIMRRRKMNVQGGSTMIPFNIAHLTNSDIEIIPE